jgi:tetratricopeptide (TPR) repeat protein
MFQYYSTVADHYLYFSMFGVALAVGWLLVRAPKPAVVIAAWVVVAALGARSLVQAGTWKDDFTLFGHAIEVNPRSFLAHNNLGSAYWSRGDVPAAERMFRRASELQPTSPDHPFNHGRALLALGRIDEGVAAIDRSLSLAETHTWAGAQKIAGQYAEAARYVLDAGRADKAIEYLQRAVELVPTQESWRRKLDELHRPASS